MKTMIKLEEAAMTAAGIYFLTQYSLGLSLWIWIPLFFSPDFSMLGYAFNTKMGAYAYNLFHHKAVALSIAALGLFLYHDVLTATGILLFTHSAFDRMMGYGLKYRDAFKHTHLGWLPDKKQELA